eukprot:ANDGO_08332.mRNA.1 hypothetical protein
MWSVCCCCVTLLLLVFVHVTPAMMCTTPSVSPLPSPPPSLGFPSSYDGFLLRSAALFEAGISVILLGGQSMSDGSIGEVVRALEHLPIRDVRVFTPQLMQLVRSVEDPHMQEAGWLLSAAHASTVHAPEIAQHAADVLHTLSLDGQRRIDPWVLSALVKYLERVMEYTEGIRGENSRYVPALLHLCHSYSRLRKGELLVSPAAIAIIRQQTCNVQGQIRAFLERIHRRVYHGLDSPELHVAVSAALKTESLTFSFNPSTVSEPQRS